uniref:SAP domain-containing protein n=1 Tax=Rhabditophanes sp. KR3021 TaxID=114890 RepID=A0AC35UDG9_9BILA
MDFSAFSYRELQSKCKEIGISAKGKTQSLVDALNCHFEANQKTRLNVDHLSLTKDTFSSSENSRIDDCFLPGDENILDVTYTKLDDKNNIESFQEIKTKASLKVTPKFSKKRVDVLKSNGRSCIKVESDSEKKRRITKLHNHNESRVPDTFKRLATPKRFQSQGLSEVHNSIKSRETSVSTPCNVRQMPSNELGSPLIPRLKNLLLRSKQADLDASISTALHRKLKFSLSTTPFKTFVGKKDDKADAIKKGLLNAKKAFNLKSQNNNRNTISLIDTRMMSNAEFMRYKTGEIKIPLKEKKLSLVKDDITSRRSSIANIRSVRRQTIVESARKENNYF